MHDAGCVLDRGCFAWGEFLGRNDLIVERENPSLLPCLQDQLRGEGLEVRTPKDLREVTCCDTAVVLLLKFSDFFTPVGFQLCEAYNI